MTDREKLEAIRAEIHRLVDVRGYDREMANDLFTFMDSLPNEPVSEELEKAANEWNAKALDTPFYMTLDDNGNPYEVRQDYTTHAESFKAGAKWGRNQAMAEIQAQSMALAHGCPKERVSEDLEEAAKHYLYSNILYDDVYIGNPTDKDCIEMFKAGSEWQKAQEYTCYEEAFEDGAKWKKEKIVDKACKWIDENAAKYLVDRFVGSMIITGIDTSITEDFRKDMED